MTVPARKAAFSAGAPRAFTTEDYHRMADAGIFRPEDRVELINGVIVEMSPIGKPHAGGVDRLNDLFTRRFRRRAIVRVQNPIVLGDYDEPQPDVTLLRPRSDYYVERHPGPGDVFLVVEVCDTSLQFDRDVKLERYALAGIADVWLIDLAHDVVEVFRQPRAERYRQSTTWRRGRRLAPLAFPRLWLRVADLLG